MDLVPERSGGNSIGYNALHKAAEYGTLAEVKVLLARSDGQKLAIEKHVSEDTVHNPYHTHTLVSTSFSFFLFIYFDVVEASKNQEKMLAAGQALRLPFPPSPIHCQLTH